MRERLSLNYGPTGLVWYNKSKENLILSFVDRRKSGPGRYRSSVLYRPTAAVPVA
jgi:hypothetical protein